ncbi:MAG: RNA methyltransferase [Bdellovibrionales bacterium]|jgi:23S rRNA (guanosine2251-2'-O)-methyltransferase|nr:RNA methyltransferase [Bdellovibrionales bacterium]
MNFHYIIGTHSIIEAISNPKRTIEKIFATEKGWAEIKKKLKRDDLAKTEGKLEVLTPHNFQERGKEIYKENDFNYSRIPGGVLLVCGKIPLLSADEIYQSLKAGKKKIVILDQVTDIQNAGAILRTASFYNIDVLILPLKNSITLNPSFFRIASGASEHIPLHFCSNISKMIKKLQGKDVACIGLSEHATKTLEENLEDIGDQSVCLVLGAEDKGLSNAVEFCIERKGKLNSFGKMKSLNVSVASAISMEKVFGVI